MRPPLPWPYHEENKTDGGCSSSASESHDAVQHQQLGNSEFASPGLATAVLETTDGTLRLRLLLSDGIMVLGLAAMSAP